MPKRSLGQNFLVNGDLPESIISFSGLKKGDTVLEIGPGKGALTMKLAKTAGRIVAIEKDDALARDLARRFNGSPLIEIRNADILECDIRHLVPAGSHIIANLPYNIATAIITGLFDFPSHFSAVTVMVQKEVGERICARVGSKEYSALSVLVASCFDAGFGFIVGPENFFPRPKVDSAVIRLKPRNDTPSQENLSALKQVVFRTFSSRRKMLRNSLSNLPGMSTGILSSIEESSGIDFSRRPQELNLSDFLRLTGLYVESVAR